MHLTLVIAPRPLQTGLVPITSTWPREDFVLHFCPFCCADTRLVLFIPELRERTCVFDERCMNEEPCLARGIAVNADMLLDRLMCTTTWVTYGERKGRWGGRLHSSATARPCASTTHMHPPGEALETCSERTTNISRLLPAIRYSVSVSSFYMCLLPCSVTKHCCMTC